MDALNEARHAGEKAKDLDTETSWAGLAQAYAAIATAEQLKRIADALENISGAYSIDLPAHAA